MTSQRPRSRFLWTLSAIALLTILSPACDDGEEKDVPASGNKGGRGGCGTCSFTNGTLALDVSAGCIRKVRDVPEVLVCDPKDQPCGGTAMLCTLVQRTSTLIAYQRFGNCPFTADPSWTLATAEEEKQIRASPPCP